jgi:hypothetical protein
MSAIDFKEIPEAHLGSGLQDTFELFARDFLGHLGYKIEEDPSRGADGGKDIVVIEERIGVGGATIVRWLVSCKHKAHSGASVSTKDEANIRDRIDANNCHGFIGFYSTLASSGLSITIKGLSSKAHIQIFDHEKIESFLLNSAHGVHLAKRFFPESIATWIGENPAPAKVFATHTSLNCQQCNKDLLNPEPSGIIVMWRKHNPVTKKTHYDQIYWCCKGSCDDKLAHSMRGNGSVDGWEDIPDVSIPLVFARWMMTPLNELNSGDTYSPDAFRKLKEFILSLYPHIARNATQKETERIKSLREIPACLGGLG